MDTLIWVFLWGSLAALVAYFAGWKASALPASVHTLPSTSSAWNRSERDLGQHEAYYCWSDGSINISKAAMAVEINGPVSERVLRLAISSVVRRHPLLRQRLVPRAGGHGSAAWPRWEAMDPCGEEDAPLTIHHAGGSAWLEVMERALCAYSPPHSPSFAVHWCTRTTDKHALVIECLQSVADACSFTVILNDLMSSMVLYTRSEPKEQGVLSSVLGPSLPLLPSIEAVVPPSLMTSACWVPALGLISSMFKPVLMPADALAAPARDRSTRVMTVTVPWSELKILRRRASDENVAVGSAMSIALLLEAGKYMRTMDARAGRTSLGDNHHFTHMQHTDLRVLSETPNIGQEAVMNASVPVYANIAIPNTERLRGTGKTVRFWELARELGGLFGLSDRSKVMGGHLARIAGVDSSEYFARADGPQGGRVATTSMCDLGVYKYEAYRGALSIENFAYCASERVTGALFSLCSLVVDRAMCLTFACPAPIVSETDQEAFIRGFLSQLDRLTFR